MSWIVSVVCRVVLAALFTPFPLAWHVNQSATRKVVAPQACSATPHLSSTFLPTYFAAWWDTNTWVSKLQALKADCITNVIIQYSADATTHTAYFPSGLTGWSEVAGQPVLADALSAADLVPGITVTVGLATNDSWFNVHASPSAMSTQATVDGALADRIWALYSVHRSLRGWYLPLEMDSTNFQTLQSWQTMAAYYGAVTQHLRSLTPGLPVVVAPFFSAAAAGAGGQTPIQWEAMWNYLLAHAKINAIAVQDGVGDSGAVDGSLGAPG
jgi:hypothetical protein